jgi:tyrosyl-tRNA synthetase
MVLSAIRRRLTTGTDPDCRSRFWHAWRMDILADLEARGLIHDTTDRDALAKRLAEGPITLYCGFDPTADSLHAGNLIGLLALRRFQLAGHRPIVLAGGATGMVGDPSGKSDERNLLDDETLTHNLGQIGEQLKRFVDFEDPEVPALFVNNKSWTQGVSYLEFLRDIGKHVTVNQMVAKESVKTRLSGDGGISYTEFSYMLLQGFDYSVLAQEQDCELQIGGSDQWGNIVLGVDLTRRRHQKKVYALTWPLLTKADGTKYGKTAGGDTMWLGAHRMSPYAFYQGWMNADDADLSKLLLQLTFLSVDDVAATVAEHDEAPHKRVGQRRLAAEITAIVHGQAQAEAAVQASELLFGGDPAQAPLSALEMIAEELAPTVVEAGELDEGIEIGALLTRTGLAKSNGEARRILAQGGAYLNGSRISENSLVNHKDVLCDRYLLLRKGKRQFAIVQIGS